MVTEVVTDEILAGIHRGIDLVERCRRGAPEEHVGHGNLDAVPVFQLADEFAEVPGELDGRVGLLRRYEDGRQLAVIEDFAECPGADHFHAQHVRSMDIGIRYRRMLQFLAIRQDLLASQVGRHAEALEGLQMGTHVLECLDRLGVDGAYG